MRRPRWRRLREQLAQAEAETAELRADLAEARRELATALTTIDLMDEGLTAARRELDRARQRLLCVGLLVQEDEVVLANLRPITSAPSALRASGDR